MRGRIAKPVVPFVFSGGAVWTAALAALPSAPAAFDATTAYVPLRNGDLTAIQHLDGAVRWTVHQAATLGPTPVADALIVADRNEVVALDKASGKTRWRFSSDASITVSPASGDRVLLVATSTGRVLGLDPATGNRIWSVELGAPMRVTPGIEKDVCYASLEDGRVVALSLKDGRTIWSRKLGGPASEPQPAGDRVFVGSTDKYFYCLAASSGRVRWRWRTGADPIGRPLVDRREVYFLSLDNLLRSVHRRGGNMRWKADLDSRPIGSAFRADDMILVATVSQQVFAYEVQDGRPAGSIAMPGRLVGIPFVAPVDAHTPPRLVILTATGQLEAFSSAVEPPIVPLDFLPGLKLTPETLPIARGPGAPA